MKIAICSDHFKDRDYNKHGDLKENTVPIQYWDLGYGCELGEIKENNIKRRLGNNSEDSFTSTDSEGNDNDSEIGTDDEFRTQLGNEIEALLNSVQNSHGQSQAKREPGLGQTLKSFYRKLNIKGDRHRKGETERSDVAGFKRATKNMCRTCAKNKTNLVDITGKNGDSDIDIITKLKLLIEIEDHDVLPAKICQQCLTKLEDAYKFFQQIYKADNILRDMLVEHKRPIKRRKHNGHIAKLKSIDVKRGDNCLEVNDMPFKNNSMKRSWTLDNGEADIDFLDEDIRKSKEDESTETNKNTVSYLLSDYCNDAELNWLDVVGIMERNNKLEPCTAKKTDETETDIVPATTGSLRISCKYCDSSFRLRRQLKTHITVDHLQPTNYMCENCSICCKSKEDLSQHHAQVHSSQIYKCDSCVETFKNKIELCLHIKNIHSDIKNDTNTNDRVNPEIDNDQTTVIFDTNETFTCNDCDKVFSTKQTLSNHIHRLHPIFSYTCTICNNVTHSEADTYKHMTTHDKSPLFPCLDCGKMFYNIEKLEKHKSTHAGKSTSKKRKRVWFHCQLCDASYRIPDELIKHIDTHSPEDWENYRNKILYCGECNARLIGEEKFRIHKMRYHLAKRGDFICLLCDETPRDFVSLDEYEKHVNSHSNEMKRAAPRRFKCEYCNKAFKSNSHRINHIDSLHSDITHTCPICDLKVKRKGNLKDHIERVHNTKKNYAGTVEVYLGGERYPCRICGEKLFTSKQRNEHEDEHQEPFKDLEKMFPWTQRYSCDHCGMKFYYIHKLREHLIDVHEDKEKAAIIETLEKNRKFRCTECEATFKHKSGLATHIKGIHSGAVHACPICDVKCKLASGLKKHLLTHNKDRLSYKCQHCDKQFKNDETRKNHESNHHSNNPKRFKQDVSNNDN